LDIERPTLNIECHGLSCNQINRIDRFVRFDYLNAMKTLTATDLKTRTGDFFEALLTDGRVTITRNGRSFSLLLEEEADSKKSLGAALAMDMTGFDRYSDWDFPKVDMAPIKSVSFDK
jgi:hypothetical protein